MNGSTRARAALTASVVAVTTTALALSAPSASAHDDDHGHGNGHFTAGAPGVGDRYYPLAGNGGYDVEHYDITGRYYPGSDVWSATTVIRARATQNLYRFDLDFDGMSIHRLEVNGERAGWVRKGAELVVTPKHKIREGSDIRVRVKYSGVPKEFALPVVGGSLRTGFMATDDGATVAGQPDVAAGWFPVNDHPRDKAAYDFHVTVPRGLGVVANGFLAGRHDRGDQTRWDWHAPEPMASYLATIDIGKWDVTRGRTESGIPYYNAVDPDLLADPVYGPSIRSSLARQGEVLDVLSSSFGPYPFRTVGAIIDDQDDLFFALETQTRPVYSKYFWPDGGDSVLAHELAHQWYGDHVALKQWQDIWLNEGWATYAEWLWGQHEGQFTPQDAFDFYYSEIPQTDPFWQFVVGQPPHEDLFGDPVYIRGAMTLQVLRNRVGDDAFFQIAQRWVKQRGGGTGTTGQFIALAERVSGQQLDDLFDAWLFTGSRPTLTTLGARSAATAAAPSPADVAAVRTWDAQFSKRVAHGRY